MIKGIAHAAYYVADMEKSMQFYCGVLGCTHAFSLKDDKGNPWIEYLKVSEGQFIELFYSGNLDKNVKVSYFHLCLEVEDIEKTAAHLRKNGIDVFSGPSQGVDLNWQCWANDPDGNPIEFMQYHPDSPQKKA